MITTAYHHHPSSRGHTRRPIPTLETASTEKEARRVLAWQQDVARSVSVDDSSSQTPTSYSPPPVKRADSYPSPRSHHPSHSQSHSGSVSGSGGKIVRRETITTESYRRRHEGDASRENGGGISSKAIIGTLLGAAAGAAVAYAMVRSESPERIPAAPISLPHHHTYPARSVAPVASVYSYGATRQHRDVIERVPARSWVSASESRGLGSRYVAPVRELERIDERSYVSRGSGRARARSEVGSRYERPLAILPAPTPRNRSPVSHVSHRSERRSHHSSRSLEREGSYHTARSAHTASTVKPHAPAPPSAVEYVSKTSSKHGLTTVRVSSREEDGRSKVSVRPSQVELPRSVVGGRGYAASVAPSDSVSSVGSKRERERLISRMRERERPSERW